MWDGSFILVNQSCEIGETNSSCVVELPSFIVGDIVFALACILFFSAFSAVSLFFSTFIKKS